MSVGPVAPSNAEFVHHIVSAAIHLGGWTADFLQVGGLPAASWPLPTEPPPAGWGPDSGAWLRPKAGFDANSYDVIVVREDGGGALEIALWRSFGGEISPHDGAGALLAGAAEIKVAPTAQLPGTYGDVVIVSDYGLHVVQIDSDGVIPGAWYAGYFKSSYRMPDGTGGGLGEEPVKFPMVLADLVSTAGEVFLEGQTVLPATALPSAGAPPPASVGTGDPPRGFLETLVVPTVVPPKGSVGAVPFSFSVLAHPFDPDLGHLRDENGAWYVGFPRTLTQMVGPADQVVARLLTYGGPLTL